MIVTTHYIGLIRIDKSQVENVNLYNIRKLKAGKIRHYNTEIYRAIKTRMNHLI